MTEWPPTPGEPPTLDATPLGSVLRSTLAYSARWLTVAVIAGVLLGPVVAVFEGVLTWCEDRLLLFWVLGLPIAGALVVGWLLRYERRVGGNGTQEYIRTFELGDRLPARLSAMKWLPSAFFF